jgi:hypothetical protein
MEYRDCVSKANISGSGELQVILQQILQSIIKAYFNQSMSAIGFRWPRDTEWLEICKPLFCWWFLQLLKLRRNLWMQLIC